MSAAVHLIPRIDSDRVGAQRPRIERFPPSQTTAGQDFTDLIALTGEKPDDSQQYVLDRAVAERPDGKLSAFEVALIETRQSGKNWILEARMLGGVFLLGERQIIYSAQRFSTVKKAHRSLVNKIRRTPAFFKKVYGYQGQKPNDDIKGIKSNGAELSIEFQNGIRIDFFVRSGDNVRGFTGDLIILDEAYDLESEEIAAMMPAMAARTVEGSPQIWYTSSSARAKSDVLRSLRERGKKPWDGTDARLCYLEWSTDEDINSDREDPEVDMDALIEAVYEANPGAGSRISVEYILETEWRAMDHHEFRCERLGIPIPLGSDDFISSTSWTRCRDNELIAAIEEFGGVEQNLRDVRITYDVSPDRSRASIGLSGVRADGRVYAEVIDSGEGVDWVPRGVADIWHARSQLPVLVQMGSAAEDLIPELRRLGVPVREVVLREYAAGCGRMFDAIKDGILAHSEQEQLDSAIRAARPSYKGDTRFIWKRAHALADITPLVTITLAANPALKALSREKNTPDDADERPTTRGGRLVARRPRAQRITTSR